MRLSLLLFCSLFLLAACQGISEQDAAIDAPREAIDVNQLDSLPTDFAAHWLAPNLLVLPPDRSDHSIDLVRRDGNDLVILPLAKTIFPALAKKRFPHLAEFQAFSVGLTPEQAKQWVKFEVMVVSADNNNVLQRVSRVQHGNLLDALYTEGPDDADEIPDLGATINATGVQFKLWAPTAQNVAVLLFNADKTPATPAEIVMTEDRSTGAWEAQGPATLRSAFYQYRVEVYHPISRKVITLVTTDPYSLGLSTNSRHSQVVDLDDPAAKPNGWDQQADVKVKAPEDNIFYELHIRDFSAHDPQLADPAHRGKYGAFTEKDSAGIRHLKELRKAGINNIHLLPTFDIGTINEDAATVIALDDPLNKVCGILPENPLCEDITHHEQSIRDVLEMLPAGGAERQAIVSSISPHDDFNWGYDPFHYAVPEGSYATDPEGLARIVEFREMVMHIHNMGFRVIMDVVYNHTHQAGLEPTAVLDKIVPNYYHRLDPVTGAIAQSTCCDNTATERVMMEKLMIDSLIVWARDYRIDGFRFDLMAHQPKTAMLRTRVAVREVDPDTYFYGEGWNFGEVANNARFVQASQLELGGTEIGTFTDRLRDTVHGGLTGSPDEIRQRQGIGNGLVTLPNELQESGQAETRYALLKDQLRIGLAGNLADFPLTSHTGEQVTGKNIPYGDQPTGYALDPADTINYVSKHDNQTLWDINQYRTPFTATTEQRVRMQLQSLSFPLFAQGIPFLHMGSELLRSKSFLRDSYDYGDWFNRVDFTGQDNNYNVGLPPADKDQANWELIADILKQNEGRDKIDAADIAFSKAVFMDLVRIRMDSPLFRLTSAEEIIKRVKFHNTGPNQLPGLIVMSIDDTDPGNQRDANIDGVVVVFNTSPDTQSFNFEGAGNYWLHELQEAGRDPVVKTSKVTDSGFTVPGFTTAVFAR